MKRIELLAPAKDKETAISAIEYGADAVYMGAKSFGARAAAGNSVEEIAEVVRYAHKFNAKVYVTINTLLFDDELEKAVELSYELYKVGVDALIVQDFGLLECKLPPIPIFASTQMHNNTPEKVKFLENVGFKRVILPRELTLREIKEIKAAVDVELEAFVHGALCVSYSGQCYLSYAIGKRSANRGECAQPCRKKYSIVDGSGTVISKPKYLLSLKDLNLSLYIKELLEAGITSFKIEGRLKDADYVKNVVAYYRKAIDKAIEGTDYVKSSSGSVDFGFEPDLYKTFNRGYTDYFLKGRKADISDFNTPKSLGEPLGKIVELSKKGFKLDKPADFHAGDGICFLDRKGELLGTLVNGCKDGVVLPRSFYGLEVGTFVYRNYNHEFAKQMISDKTKRSVGVDIRIFERDDYIIFQAEDEDKNLAETSLRNDFELANNYESALETIKKQFSKLGGTIFKAENVKVNLDKTPFIAVKELNEARRELLDKLFQMRVPVYQGLNSEIARNTIEYPLRELDFRGNVINEKARRFYAIHSAKITEKGAESGETSLKNKPVMTCKHCLRHSLGKCLKTSEDKSDWYLVDEKSTKYKLKFDCVRCEMQILWPS